MSNQVLSIICKIANTAPLSSCKNKNEVSASVNLRYVNPKPKVTGGGEYEIPVVKSGLWTDASTMKATYDTFHASNPSAPARVCGYCILTADVAPCAANKVLPIKKEGPDSS